MSFPPVPIHVADVLPKGKNVKQWIFKYGMVFHKAAPVSNSAEIFLKSITFDEMRVGL